MRPRTRGISLPVFLITCVLAHIGLSVGCSAKNAVYDYDPQTEFSRYQSFAIVNQQAVKAPQATEQAFSSLDAQRIENAIKQALENRGYGVTQQSEADAWLGWAVKPESEYQRSGFGFSIGFGSENVGVAVSDRPPLREYKTGRLALSVIEPATKKIVWQAVSKRTVDPDLSPDKRRQQFTRAVVEMLENYPPYN